MSDMTCSNRTEAFVGETHTCHQPAGHAGMHSCGCGRTWHRLNEQGLTADDEPVQRKAGKRLSSDELAEIRFRNRIMPCRGGSPDIDALLDHIDYQAAELASCRAGQPRHKDQT